MAVLENVLSALYWLSTILGALLLILLFLSTIIVIAITVLLAYSFKTGNILFPNHLILGIMFFEGPIKAVMRFFHVDDTAIDRISVDLQNRAMWATFSKVPFEQRAIFIPQCLRSVECPARLSPEGIKCKECGRCGIANAKKAAEKLGYMFFVVPGSSFIIRMVRKYHPKAIIGVGCLIEVKDGLDLMHKSKIPAIGVVLERSGCVNTILDWDRFFEVMEAYEDGDA
ncbi:hypothetical protein Mtc_2052 [Methanocella conradii HZ254]|uniref:DUF116 domain-containing protein n=1 Tax=Methanocella conradii (strain DSM 24694 / JCM 17849 / CGMCC 1.5162 / HZ254) TaxID=1041930 RepID=H8I7C5_METCZ|nr:DUF116 domain-containing protein [Methanocella conradii]AFD00791.1 hypothetical protein Mtc_2052 [Methanocella conradii HZ254]MDI6897930.1 DUF116 domain-containing protein [Methanocella conradii]